MVSPVGKVVLVTVAWLVWKSRNMFIYKDEDDYIAPSSIMILKPALEFQMAHAIHHPKPCYLSSHAVNILHNWPSRKVTFPSCQWLQIASLYNCIQPSS